MKIRLNNMKQIKLNTGTVKTNLFNETRIKMFGMPGTSGTGDPTFRILEDSDFRITESGDFRTLE